MPIFNYTCLECETTHEQIVPRLIEEVDCPCCGSLAKRQFSPTKNFMMATGSDHMDDDTYQFFSETYKNKSTLRGFGDSGSYHSMSSNKPKNTYGFNGKQSGLRLNTDGK